MPKSSLDDPWDVKMHSSMNISARELYAKYTPVDMASQEGLLFVS